MKKTKHIARGRGFTIIELMIVISIIGFLAAIAVPAFMRARRESQIVRMVNDLRIVYDAFGLYAMESGGYPAAYGQAPMPVMDYLENAKWTKPTALGGRWLYYSFKHAWLGDITLIVVDDFHIDPGGNPMSPIDYWQEVDRRIDDGNIATGLFRFVANVQMQYSLTDSLW